MVAATSKRKRMAAAATVAYLPDELWELIFKFLIDVNNLPSLSLRNSFKSLSAVSKQFLSITNRLRFSVTITDGTIPFIPRLFERFPYVTSLDITLSSRDLNELLSEISAFPLNIKSLALYHPVKFPENGLRAFSLKMKNLTSITCYRIASGVDKSDLFFVADCFPLLEELILSGLGYPRCYHDDNQLLALPKLRKIALSPNFMGRQSINDLCKNCDLLQEVTVIEDLPSPLLDIDDDDDDYCVCGAYHG
jgi:F-box and leucine-rich repeat protein 2/20